MLEKDFKRLDMVQILENMNFHFGPYFLSDPRIVVIL